MRHSGLLLLAMLLVLPAGAVTLAYRDTPGTTRLYTGPLTQVISAAETRTIPGYYIIQERVSSSDGTINLRANHSGIPYRAETFDCDKQLHNLGVYRRTAQGKTTVITNGQPYTFPTPLTYLDYNGLTVPLPARELNVGDSWTVKGSITSSIVTSYVPGTFEMHCRLAKLETVNGAVRATIESELSITCPRAPLQIIPPQGGRTADAEYAVTAKTTTVFDQSAGEVISTEYTVAITQTYYSPMPNGPANIINNRRTGSLVKQ